MKSKDFAAEIEPQTRKGLDIAVKELGWRSSDHAVQSRHPLLPVEHELHDASRQWTVASVRGRVGLSRPHEQTADRMPAVERVEEPADLVTVSDVAALELGQSHVPAVGVVENRGDLHGVVSVHSAARFEFVANSRSVITPRNSSSLRNWSSFLASPLSSGNTTLPACTRIVTPTLRPRVCNCLGV